MHVFVFVRVVCVCVRVLYVVLSACPYCLPGVPLLSCEGLCRLVLLLCKCGVEGILLELVLFLGQLKIQATMHSKL